MNSLNIQKMAAAFGLIAFGVLAVGSVLMGSRMLTGMIRGGLAALVFGGLVWGFGSAFLQVDEDDEVQDMAEDGNDPDKGAKLDETA